MQHTVIFEPDGCRGICEDQSNLLAVARRYGIDLESPCGGTQVCGKCAVKLEQGAVSAEVCEQEKNLLSPDDLQQGYRLACCTEVKGDLVAFIPEKSRRTQQVILENGRSTQCTLHPAVRLVFLELDKPSMGDSRDDSRRIVDGLHAAGITGELTIDYQVLRHLPTIVRAGRWNLTIGLWQEKEIVFAVPGRAERMYGVAIDIGTTTIAGFLGALHSGTIVAQNSLTNSQVQYGDDVISRISCCMLEDDGLEKLHRTILADINNLIERMATAAGISLNEIVDLTIVFNTVMHHIFLGISPDALGRSPFISATRRALDIKARDLGIAINSGCYAHCLPIEAGFVGADNVAVLLAENACNNERVQLLIDIGTNGEINVGNRERMFSASCATGPAFEGAQIKHGMRAAEGAIERVSIDSVSKEPSVQIIGGQQPQTGKAPVRAKGICGSGIIDVAAELFKAGLVLADGRFDKSAACARLRPDANGKYEYVLAWAHETMTGQDIVITQKDIRAIQLAKSALYAGIKLLMRRLGIDKVDTVLLAGAFGSYINVESALVIGLFPDCALEDVVVVGNAAGEGAKRALFDVGQRKEAARIAAFVEFIETAAEADFATHFADAMFFPHRSDHFHHVQHLLDAIPGIQTSAIKEVSSSKR